MNHTVMEEQATRIASLNGIDVYHIKTQKFKTNSINIFFNDNLTRENVTKNALLPAVMRRGTVKFPSLQAISLYLEELYGAVFDCGVVKKGERHIAQFYMEFVSDVYTGENAGLFDKCFDLLYEIVTNPLVEGNAFKEEFMQQEKENLKKLIEGRANDKVQYAVEKCFEEMCKDEPYGVYEYGYISDLEKITGQELYEHYKSFIETSPVKVFIAGDIPEANMKSVLDKLSQIKRGNIRKVDISFVQTQVEEVRSVEERMSVNQGKLSMGFRTNTASNDSDYYPLLVYNSILGGGTHSKLFQNVREKASLAYYAFSRLDKFKGLMVISSGVEFENRDKAQKIILEQLEEIKSGNVSDYEFDSTVKTIENGINSLRDSQLQMVDFYLSQDIVDTNDNFDTIIDKVKKVTKEDVVNIAKKIQLDTVYFLTAADKQ